MAWLEQRGDTFRIAFRFRGEKFRVNLKATEPKEANGCLSRLEENLRLVERGRLDVPPGADLGLFLISDGKLEKPVELVRAVRLSELFQTYQTEFTVGAKADFFFEFALGCGQGLLAVCDSSLRYRP